jgi:hypothetical protein
MTWKTSALTDYRRSVVFLSARKEPVMLILARILLGMA